MRFTSVRYALGVAASIAALAGCSNASSLNPVAPSSVFAPQPIAGLHALYRDPSSITNIWPSPRAVATSHGFVAHPGVVTTYVYVCMNQVAECIWYAKGHNVVAGTIAGTVSGPGGIGVSPSTGNVYIADQNLKAVVEFAPNSTAPVATFNDAGEYAADDAVDGQGNVYVANLFPVGGGTGSVSVFNASGALLRTLADTNAAQGISVAVDEHHTVEFCYYANNGFGECDHFVNARGNPIPDETSLQIPGGVSFDNAEHTVVMQPLASTLLTFASGTQCGRLVLGSTTQGQMIALNRSNTNVYVADHAAGAVEAYAFSDCATGTVTASKVYNAGIPLSAGVIGVAVTPGVTP